MDFRLKLNQKLPREPLSGLDGNIYDIFPALEEKIEV